MKESWFEKKITLGNLISIISSLITLVYFFASLNMRVDTLRRDVDANQRVIASIVDSQSKLTEQQGILTTLVNERTKKQ